MSCREFIILYQLKSALEKRHANKIELVNNVKALQQTYHHTHILCNAYIRIY